MAKLIQYCHTVLNYDYLALNKSRISVNKTVFSSISSSGSSFFTKVFAILTNINSAIATIIKSIIDWINRPYLIPQNSQSLAKSTEPKILPINGMIMYVTNDVTILLNAAP